MHIKNKLRKRFFVKGIVFFLVIILSACSTSSNPNKEISLSEDLSTPTIQVTIKPTTTLSPTPTMTPTVPLPEIYNGLTNQEIADKIVLELKNQVLSMSTYSDYEGRPNYGWIGGNKELADLTSMLIKLAVDGDLGLLPDGFGEDIPAYHLSEVTFVGFTSETPNLVTPQIILTEETAKKLSDSNWKIILLSTYLKGKDYFPLKDVFVNRLLGLNYYNDANGEAFYDDNTFTASSGNGIFLGSLAELWEVQQAFDYDVNSISVMLLSQSTITLSHDVQFKGAIIIPPGNLKSKIWDISKGESFTEENLRSALSGLIAIEPK